MNSNTSDNNTANLRDQFAMAALSGILASYSGVDMVIPGAAQDAYGYADAMMEERARREE